MSTTTTGPTFTRPDPTKMYGLLHDDEGRPLSRPVRALKVGIGVPSGKDIHVWIDAQGRWTIEVGQYGGDKKRTSSLTLCEDSDKARLKYAELRRTAPERMYPRKLPYFTFLRLHVDGSFVPDFEAIEQHGPMPSEIDVVFIKDDPLDHAFEWWTSAEKKCQGDGLNALRRVDLAKTAEEKKLAEDARARGEKFFPIIEGCYARGCMIARGDKPLCKPHLRAHFQLVASPRIGGTCQFDSTGWRTTQQIFSCVQEIKKMTGRGDAEEGYVAGIPLKMVLRPYKVSHAGKPSVQYGVSLEFRAKDAVEMAKSLIQYAADFRSIIQGAPLQIEAGPSPVLLGDDEEIIDETEDAAALSAEFYGEFEEEGTVEESKGNPFQVSAKAEAAPTPQTSPSNGASSPSNGTTSPSKPAEAAPTPKAETKPAAAETAAPKVETTAPKAAEPVQTGQPAAAPTPAPAPPAGQAASPASPASPARRGRKAAEPPPADPMAELKKSAPPEGFQATDDDLPSDLKPAEVSKPGPQLVPPPPEPTQLERIQAIDKMLAEQHHQPVEQANAAVRSFMKAFLQLERLPKPPDVMYKRTISLFESFARHFGDDLLKNPQVEGEKAGKAWAGFNVAMEAWPEEFQRLARMVAIQHYPDEVTNLLEFLELAGITAPGREMWTFLQVLRISRAAVVQLRDTAAERKLTLDKVIGDMDLEKATEAEVLSAISSAPAAAKTTDQPGELWDEQ